VPGQTWSALRRIPVKDRRHRVLRGNLAPRGAIIKQAAATRAAAARPGRAVVFDSLEDMAERIDDPDLDVTADDILVLQNAGPKGAPGMPEAGYLPIPKSSRAAGREGHGAHLRRPHERHRLRHHRAACRPSFNTPYTSN
jgi:dihydroxy-acid dehydratase